MSTKSNKIRATANGEEKDSLESHIVRIAMSGKLARASKRAVAEGVAKGLPVTFKRGNRVITRYSDGREEVLSTIRRTPFTVPKGVKIIGKK